MTIKHNNKMKRIQFLFIIAAMLCATACNKIDKTDPIDTGQTCMIVYTIDNYESSTTVKSESDWDMLLDQFCSYAEDGKSVTFHNLLSQPSDLYASKSLMHSKEGTTPTTITTTSRTEIKAWMRKMEQAGKTVNVTYDRITGVWSGRAYANAPLTDEEATCYSGVVVYANMPSFDSIPLPGVVLALRINEDSTLILVRNNSVLITDNELEGYSIGDSATLCGSIHAGSDYDDNPFLILDLTTLTPATVIGTWQYTCLTEYSLNENLNYLNVVTQYIPEDNGNSIYYNFYSDGTATRTVGLASTPSESGNWDLSNGQFCCNLSDMSGDCWSIVWLTSSTMIISRTDSENGNVIYQMQLEQTRR